MKIAVLGLGHVGAVTAACLAERGNRVIGVDSVGSKVNRVAHGPSPIVEMVKYVDNAFHAVKVTFANEMGRICAEFGLDARTVMDIFRSDTRLNISRQYLRPGFAFT
jgi:GDP-mannose 6-dehydrogenase